MSKKTHDEKLIRGKGSGSPGVHAVKNRSVGNLGNVRLGDDRYIRHRAAGHGVGVSSGHLPNPLSLNPHS
eukprot:9094725-Pyramimonas_sp.AAC.1